MITIDEIAKIANVSKTAVSFALNNKPGISEETRNNILKIARQEGYFEKNKNRKNTSQNILLVMCSKNEHSTIGSWNAPFHSELIREIEKSANEFGYNLLLKSLSIENGEEIVPLFSGLVKNTAGVIVIGTDIVEKDVALFMDLCEHIVVVDSFFEATNVNCVVMDNYLGGITAAKQLIELGHTDIGYIESSQRIYNFDSRKSGFMRAMSNHQLKIDPKNVYAVLPGIDEAREALEKKVDIDHLPTAFFAENDYLAIGLLQCLTHKGIRVPEQVSIIGFDDIEISSFTQPKLTTIRVFKKEIARIAVKNIISMIENESGTTIKEIVGVELIERDSCKKIK